MSTLRNAMHIPTIDEFYEYRMKRIVNKLVEGYPEEFEALSPEEVQDKI